MSHPKIEEIIRRDPRYPIEAYQFVDAALCHTQTMLGRPGPGELARGGETEHHVSGPQLLHGIRDLALREFGLMARTVFRMWGINRTDDFGDIVFNLIDAGLMSRTPQDQREDFNNVYDLDEALTRDYRIEVPVEAQDN